MPDSSLSVVIPTRNSKKEKNFSLLYVLKSIRMQTIPVEIIVVDDNGTDGSCEIAAAEFPGIRVVRSPEREGNVAAARNHGAALATGSTLLFLDDDTLLTERDALRGVVDLAAKFDYACGAKRRWTSVYWYKHVQSRQSITSALQTLRDLSFLPSGLNAQVGFRDLNEYTFIGNFGVIRRSVFESSGGFDERFRGWGLEDTDLMMRLCLDGYHHALLGDHGISVIHLTHARETNTSYLENLRLFNDLEMERGLYFHVNHFFGVYEGDGYGLFTRI